MWLFGAHRLESFFLAHSFWQKANKFGKKWANLSLKFAVLIVCENERHYFFAKCCAPATFYLANKVW